MIYGIGLPRCGGQSLCKALAILYGECVHSPGKQPINAPAAVEVFRSPALILSEDPEARLILNVREFEPWMESCRRVYHKSEGWNHPIWKYPLRDFTSYRADYLQKRYGLGDVLIWDLTKEPDWKLLCDFLEKPIPDTPFPNLDMACR